MPSLWSEVQLTYVLIVTVFLGIFRAIDIGLHSRDLHTAQSAHSAMLHLRAFGAIKPGQEAGNIIVQGSCHVFPTHSPEQMCFDEMIGVHFISPAPPLPTFTHILTHD